MYFKDLVNFIQIGNKKGNKKGKTSLVLPFLNF